MLERQYPQAGAQASMLLPYFANPATQQLISEKILLAEANRMGLRASDDDVRQYLRRGQLGETLFPGGTFIGQDGYQDFASRLGFTIPQLEQAVKDDILSNKLRALVTATASVSEADIKRQFEKQNTKVKFNYAVIKKDDILKAIKPADSELKAYYDRNKQTYINSIPEKRQLKYVVLDTGKLQAQTQVTQQDLESYYGADQCKTNSDQEAATRDRRQS
jgi:peptidyl-prolyl cis-trans isomerase D